MGTNRVHLLAAVSLLAVVVFCPGPLTAAKPNGPAQVTLTILHINDTHGQLGPRVQGGRSSGGIARLATYVQQVRQAGDANLVLLLHAGDVLSRGDELTRKTLGAANVRLFNMFRFSAWTPGNGEYYDGPAVLRKRIAEANFPVLAANVVDRLNGKTISQPYAVLQAGKVRVGVLGLCFVRTSLPSALTLRLDDPVKTARKLVPELRAKADVVVVLSHLGLSEDQKLAGAVPGIDLIVGGHSHSTLPKGVLADGLNDEGKRRKVLIVQAGDQYRYCGQVTMKLRREGDRYRPVTTTAKLVALSDPIAPDPAVAAELERLRKADGDGGK